MGRRRYRLAVRDITVEVKDFPKADQKIPARSFHESGGGPVPTALVTLSRLGRRTMLSSVVGHDPIGETIRRNLDDEGVDVGAVVSRDTFRSPTSVIVVENGRRTIFEAPASSGGLPLSWPEVESRLPLNDSRSLLLDARLPDIQLRAAARAREAGALVVLDCGHPREGVDELLALSDVAILSHTYPQTLHGDDFDEEAFVSGLVERDCPRTAPVWRA